MDTERTEIETTDAGAPVADTTSSQDVAEGSASPAEAGEARSLGETVRDEFLKEFGQEPAEGQEPDPTTEATPNEAPDPERQDAPEDDKAPRLSDEEFKALTPKARARIGFLSEQTRTLKREHAALNTQVEELRPQAQALQTLRTFAAENNLRSEDVTNGLAIMARLQNGNFEGFLKDIMPFVEMAQRATGQAVTPEIQALVDAGEITEAAAKRMTKAEVDATMARQAAARAAERTQEVTTAQANAGHIAEMQAAVRKTEAALRLADTTYALKEQAIRKQFGDLLKRGALPKTAEDAAAMIREIHESIGQAMALAPKPRPQPTAKTPDASDATRRAPAPANIREAVFAGWENARAS